MKKPTSTVLLRIMMKRTISIFAIFILAAMLLMGCSFQANVNKKNPSIEDTLAHNTLLPDSVKYNPEGTYQVTFHSDKGGFKKMDLSQAYVAYYPTSVMDQIDAITSDDGSNEIPPLPDDAQVEINEAIGADQLQKIAVITIVTLDDNTLEVSFTDNDNPVEGKEYFFIIPNEGISGSVIPD